MDLYQHFRPEEHPFIDQVISWKEIVMRTYQRKLTDFLNPRQQQIVDMLIGANDYELTVGQFGGGPFTERKRAIIAPYYEEMKNHSYKITLMQASYQKKFITLQHRDVLGAFLSLGIKRDKLGDIIVENGTIQILCATEIAHYVRLNLTSIKNATIQLEEKPLSKLIEKKLVWQESMTTVSSLRLDNVIKEIYNISRKEASEMIAKKLVKVNFKVIEDAKFQLQPEDLLSVRGKGRSKLVAVHSRTRKDRLRITTARLK
ncbi:MAG TPA: YlmH/Sll1252 family protein [Bacillota bacterium]